jgi:hypothetical protein
MPRVLLLTFLGRGREMAELIVVTSLQSAVAQLLQGGLEPLLYTFVRGE